MSIYLQPGLPAIEVLEKEKICILKKEELPEHPVEVLVLNLMPTKTTTETQLARLLGSTALPVKTELLKTATHVSAHADPEHMNTFYRTFEEVKDRYYHGLIITGAPVEQLPFEEVDYWDELCQIMEWSKTHVNGTLHICWGAQAGLYYHYGIDKIPLPEKMFGIFPHHVTESKSVLFRGFDDVFMIPHSRHTSIRKEDIQNVKELLILAESEAAGVYAVADRTERQVFITGHSEYDPETLEKEYIRDKTAGLPIHVPENYYPNDDDTQRPVCSWRSSAHLLFANWLNSLIRK